MSVAPAPGATFAGYRIEEVVGRGGMGLVYRATDLSLERPVALKLIAPELAEDERFRARFLREPRLAAALDHPHVVPIYEAGERDGQLYLAMRYVDGSDLKTILKRGTLSPERALAMLAQVAGALDAAHRRGLIHRDVKPANVLLDASEHAYLTDFGISKQLGGDTTDTGAVVGTLAYMAPEQIRGEGADGRTDGYALACIFYECLAGTPPFRRATEAETLWAHMQEEPAPLPGHHALDPVLRKALAKDRKDRYGSCGGLIEAAREAPVSGSTPRPAPAVPPAGTVTKTSPVARRRKTVTVLFCDCSASAADLDPESLERVVSQRLEAMRSVIEGHGGTVERLASDAVVGVFGVPRVHEDDPLRAVRAAVELRSRLATPADDGKRWDGAQVSLRIGISTGLVVAGQSPRGHPLLTGDVLNLAARLAHGAGTGEIRLAGRTWPLVKGSAMAKPAASDGEGDAATAFSLLEVLPARSRQLARLDSPLVGRRRELELLVEVFERVVHERACHLFTLLGAAGVGKSRLVEEFVCGLPDSTTVLRGRCLPYGEGITLWPVAELIKEAADLSDDDSLHSARGKVRGLLEGEKDADELADRITEVLGLGGVASEKEVIFWSIRRLCEALTRERPLVVVFDDIQWAEPTFLELVEHVADWSSDAPILLVCVARPELVETRADWGGGKLNATSVLLEPLARADCEELIEGLLGRASVAESARVHIAEATGGNPLFVEELVAMLVEAGFLRRANGSWTAVRDLSLAPIPATIQALLLARLDRLDPDERALIEHAAIEGEVFHRGAVSELAAGTFEGDVGRCLLGLTRKALIRRDRPSFAGEEAFRFRHLLVRDAAYESLAKETRGELHERFATWLELKAGERVGEHDEILGYHLEQGFRYREQLAALDEHARSLAVRASERLGAAGGRALARGDMPAASNLLDRAASLLPAGEVRRRNLQLQLGLALSELGDISRAEDVLSEAAQAGAAAGDRRLEVRALLERSYWRLATSQVTTTDELRRALDEAIPVLERENDEAGLARAWGYRAFLDSTALRWAAVAESYERGLAHARRAADTRQQNDLLWGLSAAFLYGPTPADAAIQRFREILDEVAEAGEGAATDAMSSSSLAVVEATGLAGLEAMRGNVERARTLSERAKAIFLERGQKLKLAVLGQDSGWVELLAGAPATAEAELRESYEILEEMGETGYLSTTAAWLSEAIYAQGRYDEAHRLTHVTERTAARDDVNSHVMWRGTRAKILARRGSHAAAEGLAREAVELAAGSDDLNLRADTLMGLAEIMRLAERPVEAAASTKEALELYAAKGNLPASRRARAALERLGR